VSALIDVANSDLFITHHGAIANFTFSGAGHCPGKFDELRWGDTFLDVTPFGGNSTPGNTACQVDTVPTPATLGLLAFGLAALVPWRRRAGPTRGRLS
jgi:MYXO-CTERM domain-containing protein